MQRQDPEGIVIACDFCRRDWDGQEPMIEGHHGSILCLECLKLALAQQNTNPVGGPDSLADGQKFKCTLCLRFNIPIALPHWCNPEHPDALLCQECLYQAAKAFHKNPDVPFRWDPANFPPPIHIKIPDAPEET